MFEKELNKFRDSVKKTIKSFFGKDMTIHNAYNWITEFTNKHDDVYDIDKVEFSKIKPEHREDFAKYRTLSYFFNVLIKLNELENVIRGGENDKFGI